MFYRRFCIVKFNRVIEEINGITEVNANKLSVRIIKVADQEIVMYVDAKVNIPRHKRKIFIDEFNEVNSFCERTMEQVAEIISIANNSGFQIKSVVPMFVVMPENNMEKIQLKSLAKTFIDFKIPIHFENLTAFFPLDDECYSSFDDRLMGVNSLAEAITSFTSIAKFKELVRFFENAFKIDFSPNSIVVPLTNLLAHSDLGYQRREVQKWANYRGGLVHGDRKKGHFYFERDIANYIPRMLQAAAITLKNKEAWHDPSDSIRDDWKPDFCIMGENSDAATQRVGTTLKTWLGTNRDIFGSWVMSEVTYDEITQITSEQGWQIISEVFTWQANIKAI